MDDVDISLLNEEEVRILISEYIESAFTHSIRMNLQEHLIDLEYLHSTYFDSTNMENHKLGLIYDLTQYELLRDRLSEITTS